MKKYIAIVALVAVTSFSVNAAELLMTSDAEAKASKEVHSARLSQSITLDVATDGDVVGFQFNIPLPKNARTEQVNIKYCVSEVPKKYFSNCSVAKNHIIVQVANDDGNPIPAGIFPVGKVVLNGLSAKDLGTVHFIAADKNAEAIQSLVRAVE